MDSVILEAIFFYLFYYTGKFVLLLLGGGSVGAEKCYIDKYGKLWNYSKLTTPFIVKNNTRYLVFEWVILLGFCFWVILGVILYFIKNY